MGYGSILMMLYPLLRGFTADMELRHTQYWQK